MRQSIQVTFRNMAVSPLLEQEVRERAEWLDTFYDQIVGCRVLLEVPHRHKSRGRPIHVRIELSVPGEDIFVNQHTTRRFILGDREAAIVHETEGGHKDVVVAIHEAFDVARRRLEDFVRRQRADVKSHQPRAASGAWQG